MTPFTARLTQFHAAWSASLNALDDAKEARRRTDATLNAKLRSPDYRCGCARAESMTARAARLRLEAAQLDEVVAYGAFDSECNRLRGLSGAARQEELRRVLNSNRNT